MDAILITNYDQDGITTLLHHLNQEFSIRDLDSDYIFP